MKQLKIFQDYNTVYRNIKLSNVDSNISFDVLKLDAISLDDIKYVNHALDVEKNIFIIFLIGILTHLMLMYGVLFMLCIYYVILFTDLF